MIIDQQYFSEKLKITGPKAISLFFVFNADASD